MSILGKIFGVGDAAATPINAVGKIVDELFTSKEEKLSHEEVKLRLMQKPDLAQAEINKVSAAHRSVFVAGWRPFIGWVCGTAVGVFYIPQFATASYLWVKYCLEGGKLIPYPEVNSDRLFELLAGMLGMAALRTYEKLKNKTK